MACLTLEFADSSCDLYSVFTPLREPNHLVGWERMARGGVGWAGLGLTWLSWGGLSWVGWSGNGMVCGRDGVGWCGMGQVVLGRVVWVGWGGVRWVGWDWARHDQMS